MEQTFFVLLAPLFLCQHGDYKDLSVLVALSVLLSFPVREYSGKATAFRSYCC